MHTVGARVTIRRHGRMDGKAGTVEDVHTDALHESIYFVRTDAGARLVPCFEDEMEGADDGNV